MDETEIVLDVGRDGTMQVDSQAQGKVGPVGTVLFSLPGNPTTIVMTVSPKPLSAVRPRREDSRIVLRRMTRGQTGRRSVGRTEDGYHRTRRKSRGQTA